MVGSWATRFRKGLRRGRRSAFRRTFLAPAESQLRKELDESIRQQVAAAEPRLRKELSENSDRQQADLPFRSTPPFYMPNVSEPSVQALFPDFIRPGDTVFDVGADIGSLTQVLSRTVGPRGLVVSFEANPATFPLLNANIIKNAQFNCFVVPLAVFTHSHKLLQIAEFGAASKLAPVGDYPVGTILRDDFCAQIDLWPSSSKWISKAASMTRCSEQNTSSKKAPDICSGAYGRRRSRNQSSHTRGILAHVRIYLFRSSIIKRLQSPTASSQHRRNPIRETRAYQICDAATTCAADYSDVLACHVLSRCHGATCGNQTTAC
jgi:hypothetical protein